MEVEVRSGIVNGIVFVVVDVLCLWAIHRGLMAIQGLVIWHNIRSGRSVALKRSVIPVVSGELLVSRGLNWLVLTYAIFLVLAGVGSFGIDGSEGKRHVPVSRTYETFMLPSRTDADLADAYTHRVLLACRNITNTTVTYHRAAFNLVGNVTVTNASQFQYSSGDVVAVDQRSILCLDDNPMLQVTNCNDCFAPTAQLTTSFRVRTRRVEMPNNTIVQEQAPTNNRPKPIGQDALRPAILTVRRQVIQVSEGFANSGDELFCIERENSAYRIFKLPSVSPKLIRKAQPSFPADPDEVSIEFHSKSPLPSIALGNPTPNTDALRTKDPSFSGIAPPKPKTRPTSPGIVLSGPSHLPEAALSSPVSSTPPSPIEDPLRNERPSAEPKKSDNPKSNSGPGTETKPNATHGSGDTVKPGSGNEGSESEGIVGNNSSIGDSGFLPVGGTSGGGNTGGSGGSTGGGDGSTSGMGGSTGGCGTVGLGCGSSGATSVHPSTLPMVSMAFSMSQRAQPSTTPSISPSASNSTTPTPSLSPSYVEIHKAARLSSTNELSASPSISPPVSEFRCILARWDKEQGHVTTWFGTIEVNRRRFDEDELTLRVTTGSATIEAKNKSTMDSLFELGPYLSGPLRGSSLLDLLDTSVLLLSGARNSTSAYQTVMYPITRIAFYSQICILLVLISAFLLGPLREIVLWIWSKKGGRALLEVNQFDVLSNLLGDAQSTVSFDEQPGGQETVLGLGFDSLPGFLRVRKPYRWHEGARGSDEDGFN